MKINGTNAEAVCLITDYVVFALIRTTRKCHRYET